MKQEYKKRWQILAGLIERDNSLKEGQNPVNESSFPTIVQYFSKDRKVKKRSVKERGQLLDFWFSEAGNDIPDKFYDKVLNQAMDYVMYNGEEWEKEYGWDEEQSFMAGLESVREDYPSPEMEAAVFKYKLNQKAWRVSNKAAIKMMPDEF